MHRPHLRTDAQQAALEAGMLTFSCVRTAFPSLLGGIRGGSEGGGAPNVPLFPAGLQNGKTEPRYQCRRLKQIRSSVSSLVCHRPSPFSIFPLTDASSSIRTRKLAPLR